MSQSCFQRFATLHPRRNCWVERFRKCTFSTAAIIDWMKKTSDHAGLSRWSQVATSGSEAALSYSVQWFYDRKQFWAFASGVIMLDNSALSFISVVYMEATNAFWSRWIVHWMNFKGGTPAEQLASLPPQISKQQR